VAAWPEFSACIVAGVVGTVAPVGAVMSSVSSCKDTRLAKIRYVGNDVLSAVESNQRPFDVEEKDVVAQQVRM
jgi:hypothetical protein